MAKDTVVTTLETTKRSILMIDPAQCLVVGVDFGDENTPGYDARIKYPIDPLMVESIKKYGVVNPISCRKDGERYVVNAGRRRVLHSRAANLQLQTENPAIAASDLIRIPVMLTNGDEKSLLTKNRISNAYAVKDSGLLEAQNMQQMLDKGASMREVELAFGVSAQSIGDKLKLLELGPEGQKELAAGNITQNAALELTGVPMAEQVKVLQKARDEAIAKGRKDGKLSTATITTAARDAKPDTAKNKLTPSDRVKAIVKLVETLAADLVASRGDRSPLSKDGKQANAPEPASLDNFLRKVTKLTQDKTWDALVKGYLAEAKRAEEDAANAA